MPLLGLIRTKGRDVDQGGDAWVNTGVRDDGAPVGVADKNDRTADAAECADGRVDIASQRVQAVLRSHHLVTLRLKRRDQLLEQEPSAQMPWAKTMLGLFCSDIVIPSSEMANPLLGCLGKDIAKSLW